MSDWHQDAACIGIPVSFFFPTQGEGHEQANRICASCPVRSQCLEAELDVMRTGAISRGIFGGTSARQRRRMLGGVGPGPVRRNIHHGTRGGAITHRKRGETPCAFCDAAERAHGAARREQQRLA